MAVRLGDDLPEEVSKEDIQHMLDKADAARHGVEAGPGLEGNFAEVRGRFSKSSETRL